MPILLFPKTVAQDDAFCNREDERGRLRRNIDHIQHTLVVSPRRYGKTSLILKTIQEIDWPCAHVDLFLALEEQKIVTRFLDGIANLLAQITPINMKAIAKIKDFFKSFSISIAAGEFSFNLQLAPTQTDSATTIKNAIEGLEKLLQKQKKKVVFFIDEMQDMVQSSICEDIEAILRFYAQKTKNIAFIFSGSNRKLLKEIFDDRRRPLFKMCDRINLKRISEASYQDFLNHASLKKWKQKLSQESMAAILNLTERHTYYVNYLCSNLWALTHLPTEQDVKNAWEKMGEEEMSAIAIDIDTLSANQKKLLDYIAHENILTNLASFKHQKQMQLTARGISQSLKGLLERDIVEKVDGGIRIVDPLLKSILKRL